MMTRKLLWFIPVFLLCILIAQPSYAYGDLGGIVTEQDGNTPPSSSNVQIFWDVAFKEMSVQTTAAAGNIQATIQCGGQTVYNQMIGPNSFVMIPLWQIAAGNYKLTLTDSKGVSLIFTFTLK